jgi:hypothetical protein
VLLLRRELPFGGVGAAAPGKGPDLSGVH